MNRKVSIHIGINYPNTDMELRGCINDASIMVKKALEFGIDRNDINLFVDSKDRKYYSENYYNEIKDIIDNSNYPSINNILSSIRKILSDETISILFLTCSCHGTRLNNIGVDYEEDGKDDAFCLVDDNGNFNYNTCLIDDDFRKIIHNYTNRRKNPIYIFTLIDICHSGTLLDLEHEQHIRKHKNTTLMVNRKINRKIQPLNSSKCYICSIGTGQEIQSVLEDYGNYQDSLKGITRGRGTDSFCKAIDKIGTKNVSMTEILEQMIKELDKIDGNMIGNTNSNSQLPVLSSSIPFITINRNTIKSIRFLVSEDNPNKYININNIYKKTNTKCLIVSDKVFFANRRQMESIKEEDIKNDKKENFVMKKINNIYNKFKLIFC